MAFLVKHLFKVYGLVPGISGAFFLVVSLTPFFDTPVIAAMPFYSRNLSPFVLVHGLPPVEGGEIEPPGNLSGRLHFELANNYTFSNRGDESILLDGETYRSAAVFRYGIRDGYEFGLEIPYISHERGELDGFIEGWHDFLGLPENGRELRPRNQLDYRYEKNGEVIKEVDAVSHGIGDISLSGGYQLFRSGTTVNEMRAVGLRTTIKLPTGKASELHGSGGTDLAMSLEATDNKTLAVVGLGLFGRIGFLWLGSGEVLNSIRKDFVGFACVGMGWQAMESLELKIQIDSHTPFYDSLLTELGANSAQLNLGGTIRLSPKTSLDLNVIEDIVVDTAPDVVFQISLKNTF